MQIGLLGGIFTSNTIPSPRRYCQGATFQVTGHNMYTGEVISDVKGSVCFVLKFALPPFSPPPPYVVQLSGQNRHRTFDIINT